MKSEIVAYLAGCMSELLKQGRYDEATGWRIRCKGRFNDVGIKVFDPTKNSLEHYQHPPHYSKGVVRQNEVFLDKCDILIVNLTLFEESFGTIFEVIDSRKKMPIIGFGKCEKWMDVPHFKDVFTVICEDEEEAIDYIISMYGGMI